MEFREYVKTCAELLIKQRREYAELFGFETRNHYSIERSEGQQIGVAVEQGDGFMSVVGRQLLGHWRSFRIDILGANGQPIMRANHPFRFYFQRLEVSTAEGKPIGVIEKRFSLLSKKFEVLDPMGQQLMTVSSPVYRIWTFPFMKAGNQVAVIEKKWSGIVQESVLDADKFRVKFDSPSLSQEERLLLVAAGVYIDLAYFERKANSQ